MQELSIVEASTDLCNAGHTDLLLRQRRYRRCMEWAAKKHSAIWLWREQVCAFYANFAIRALLVGTNVDYIPTNITCATASFCTMCCTMLISNYLCSVV